MTWAYISEIIVQAGLSGHRKALSEAKCCASHWLLPTALHKHSCRQCRSYCI